MTVADDFLTVLLPLSKSNPPGPGRPFGRLRVSLAGTVARLAEQFNISPAEVRRSITFADGSPLKFDKHDRAFLTKGQMQSMGGYKRAGSQARVRFLLPPKRHVYDVLYFDVKAKPSSGAEEQPIEATNYSPADGIDTGGSGKGVTFRVTMRARGDPTKQLERMNDRLRNRFKRWLQGFDPSWVPSTGIVAQSIAEGRGPRGKTWMVQKVAEKKGQDKISESAGGPIVYDSSIQTRFKVAYNDLTDIAGKGPNASPVRVGEVFTEN